MPIDFSDVRQKISSDDGQILLSQLNNLNVDIEETGYKLEILKMKYFVKMCDYKKFLGYEISVEDQKKCDDYVDTLVKFEED